MILVDTNIVLRSVQPGHMHFTAAKNAIKTHHVSGKSGHDARIAAAMDRHGIERLVSFDDQHFHRFPSITAIHPGSIDNLQPA